MSRLLSRSATFNSNKSRARRRSQELSFELLESREMLSATPLTFRVVDDASLNKTFAYTASGTAQGSTTLATANSAPRGVTSTIGVDKTWVVDANRNVYVYNSTGGLVGSWSAGSMSANATPEGIATDGSDVWIIDSRNHMAYRYAGAASRLSGGQNAASSFFLGSGANQTDIVTDGHFLFVLEDGKKADWVHRWTMTGGDWGYWQIDAANKTPTGIALDPANVGDIWISDSGTDRVYRYAGAVGFSGGSLSAASSFALASGDGNAQGLAVAGRAWAETPYQVDWVRQLGTTGSDVGRAVTTDSAGNVYVTGGVAGSLTEPNPSGVSVPFFAKYDSAGNLQWVQQFDSSAGANYGGGKIATDDLGNVFLVTGHGGPNTAPVNPPTTVNNYDAAGNLRWSTPLPLSETGAGIAADNLGYVYNATFDDTTQSPDGFEYINLRKFDALTGSIVWTQRLHVGGYPNNTSTVTVDGLGHVYVAAYTSGSLIGPNAGGTDAVVAQYTLDGNLVWAKQFGSAGDDNNFQVAADALGNVWSTGGTYGNLGGAYAGGQDVYLAKHDVDGNLQWIRHWGTTGEEINAKIWADGQGNVFMATSSSAALAGPNLGGDDIVVAKYDSDGNQLWAKQFGTSGSEIPSGGAITGDKFGNIYITGSTTSSWGAPNAGSDDVVLIKLSPPGGGMAGSSQNSVSVLQSASSTSTNNSCRQGAGLAGAADIQSSTDAGQRLSLLLAIHKSQTSKDTASQFSTSAMDAAITQGIGEKWSNLLEEVLAPIS